jgi:hypothetical protein
MAFFCLTRSIQALTNRWRDSNCLWWSAKLRQKLCASLALVGAMAAPAQAGLFQPLLKLGQPTVEGRIRQECEALAGQHLGDGLKGQWQPICQLGAQKITACLLEQANRQGKEWALLQEGIRGKAGAVTQSLLLACAGQLLGLDGTLGTVDRGGPPQPSKPPAL